MRKASGRFSNYSPKKKPSEDTSASLLLPQHSALSPQYSVVSSQRLCGCENLLGPRAYKVIRCHHAPANCARRIDQELSGTRDVCVCSAGAGRQIGVVVGVNQIIAANCLEFWIREKSKSVSSFLDHLDAGCLGWINTNRNYTNSSISKRLQIVFETPQLGVA